MTTAHPKTFPACSVFTRRFLVTASNNGYYSASVFKFSLKDGSLPIAYSSDSRSNLFYDWQFTTNFLASSPLKCTTTVPYSQKVKLMLRLTVSRPVYLAIKHPSGAYDQIFITVRQLRVCWCGALSLTSGRVWRLQFLLVLASAVILESESRRTRGHILLSQIRDFPFRRLLRLARLRWRYSTPPPHGLPYSRFNCPSCNPFAWTE
jgi:hypothetical protein